MQLASEYTSIFDKLVAAYAQIAEALPRFDRFDEAFKDHPTFQEVLSVVYADILEFHRRAYKFLRRRGLSSFSVFFTGLRVLMLCSLAYCIQLFVERFCCTVQRDLRESGETYRTSG